MFDQFAGTFLIHPAMLDYSGNTCSHQCAYCFANLNEPVRDAHFRQTLKWIDNIKKRGSLTQILADEGYPICFSNRSDPLSDSNVAQTFAIVEKLKKLPNGIFFQTKGGKKQDDFVKLIEPMKDRVIVYITFTTNDEKISKQIEPHAPSPAQRIDFMKKLIASGIAVEVGFNPYVDRWLPFDDAIETAEKLFDMGVSAFFVQGLYLYPRWVDKFNARRWEALGDLTIQDAIKEKGDVNISAEIAWALADELLEHGLPTEHIYAPRTTFIGNFYRTKFRIHSPVLSDFYGWANAQPDDKIFSWKDFVYGCAGGDENNLKAYNRDIGRTLAPYVFRVSKRGYLQCDAIDQNPRTIAGLLKTIWKSKYFKQSPYRCKGYFVDAGKDDEGSPLFRKNLTNEFFANNARVSLKIKNLWTKKLS